MKSTQLKSIKIAKLNQIESRPHFRKSRKIDRHPRSIPWAANAKTGPKMKQIFSLLYFFLCTEVSLYSTRSGRSKQDGLHE